MQWHLQFRKEAGVIGLNCRYLLLRCRLKRAFNSYKLFFFKIIFFIYTEKSLHLPLEEVLHALLLTKAEHTPSGSEYKYKISCTLLQYCQSVVLKLPTLRHTPVASLISLMFHVLML
jgi:hypothetical protein